MLYPEYGDFEEQTGALIKVVGVGGGGGNAVNHMVANMVQQEFNGNFLGESAIDSEEHGKIVFYAVNTDAQALRKSQVQQTVQIGGATTKGLGAGANPNVGRKAAEDDQEEIRKMLEGADMVFIAAGMGGGTGTGAAPIVAKVAKELGILTVAVVTKPFSFEGKKRMQFAELGIKDLSQYVDSMIIIPNQQIQKVLPKNATLIDAFAAAGLINVDFADVRTVMSEMGQAMIGFGSAQSEPGAGRAEEAARLAIKNDLLEKVDLSNAKGILVNITSGMDLGFDEFNVVGDTVGSFASEDATIVVGTSLVPEMSNEIRVTIVATGLGDVVAAEPVVIARPQAAVQQAPVQQPVAQETIQPQPPVGLHGLDALRHNPQPEPAQEQNPQYGNLNKPLDPSRLEQLRNNPNFFNPASFGRDEK